MTWLLITMLFLVFFLWLSDTPFYYFKVVVTKAFKIYQNLDSTRTFYVMIILLTTNLLIPELKAQSKLEQQNDSINFGQITSPHLDSLTFGDNDIFPTYKFDGELGLYKFLNDSIRYPEEFIEGKVYVSFIVDTIGKIKDAIILKGLNEESNKEVLRVVSKLEFIPGESKGKKVEVKYNLSFIFRRF